MIDKRVFGILFMCRWCRSSLRTLVVIADTDGALTLQALRPEAANFNVGLWDALVSEQEPGTEDWLGKDVQDGVSDDLLVHVHVARAVGNTPDAASVVSDFLDISQASSLHWVDGPDDQGEATNSSEEAADLATLGSSGSTAVDNELPDDDQVSSASNGVPAPLLWCVLRAESSEETSQDHDHISDDGNENIGATETSKQSQVEEQERGGQAPIDITSPVDLAVDVLGGVRDVLVGLADDDVVVANAVAAGHGEVRHGGKDGDQSSDNVVETAGLEACVSMNLSRIQVAGLRLARSRPCRRTGRRPQT
jgi:hypothetical protein